MQRVLYHLIPCTVVEKSPQLGVVLFSISVINNGDLSNCLHPQDRVNSSILLTKRSAIQIWSQYRCVLMKSPTSESGVSPKRF